MLHRLFHCTSTASATAIERRGFRDSKPFPNLHGVFLSDRPLTLADGVSKSCDVCFVLSVPADFDLQAWEVIEDERPSEAYREWLVPAKIVNHWNLARFVELD